MVDKNLPPNMTDNDIPGQRPPDLALLDFLEWIEDYLLDNPEINVNDLRKQIEQYNKLH